MRDKSSLIIMKVKLQVGGSDGKTSSRDGPYCLLRIQKIQFFDGQFWLLKFLIESGHSGLVQGSQVNSLKKIRTFRGIRWVPITFKSSHTLASVAFCNDRQCLFDLGELHLFLACGGSSPAGPTCGRGLRADCFPVPLVRPLLEEVL